jgi:SAM-dependent methyltransferase
MPFWHPLSTILLSDPRCFATDGLVRMLLASERSLELVYAGDRMWPAVRHGQSLIVEPVSAGDLARGDAVLVSRSGIPDLLRVSGVGSDGVTLAADADPEPDLLLPAEAVLGRTSVPRTPPAPRLARLRRLALDVREAWTGRPDRSEDPAATVCDKYDSQAALYARGAREGVDQRLLERIRDRVASGGRVLVVGSGSGRECFALARAGWSVRGIEFSPSMVALSRDEAERLGLAVDIRRADIREHTEPAGSLDGVVFTYDVYSFLPRRRERVAMLQRMRAWLRPGGIVFLSARRLLSLFDRMVLGLQWTSLSRAGDVEWGDSHTRWIPDDGRMRRSFVHVFSTTRLRAEVADAGYRMEPWEGGHAVLAPERTAIIVR